MALSLEFEAVDAGAPPSISAGNTGVTQAVCPVGKIAISGAWTLDTNDPDVRVVQSRQDSSDPRKWNVTVRNDNSTGSVDGANVIAYCIVVD